MALSNNFIVGGRIASPDDVQFEINKLEAAIAEQNRILNHLTTETSLSTNKALRKELAQFKLIPESLEAIAEQLGIKFTGNTDDIYEAIANLKKSAHREDYWHGLYKSAIDDLNLLKSSYFTTKEMLEAIANALGFEYIPSPYSKATILEAITNLKHSLQLSQDEADELRKKSAIADRLQSDSVNTDMDDLRSERDHYRGILEKLCDRLDAPDIEALEHIAKYQEMDLDFKSQHNDDLRQQLAESQAVSYRYVGRICELENELRSLQSSVPDSDRLSNLELIQIIRSLLK